MTAGRVDLVASSGLDCVGDLLVVALECSRIFVTVGGSPVLGRCPEEVFASYGEGSVGFESEDDEVVGLELEVLLVGC